MARAIWSGVLSFGLAAIPVELYSATEAHRSAFHQFEEGRRAERRHAATAARSEDELRALREQERAAYQLARASTIAHEVSSDPSWARRCPEWLSALPSRSGCTSLGSMWFLPWLSVATWRSSDQACVKDVELAGLACAAVGRPVARAGPARD